MSKLTQSIFDQYEKYYVEQGMPLTQVAFEFQLNYGSLRQHSMKNRWTEKRNRYLDQTNKKLTEITKKRIKSEAETLAQKNARRSTYWRLFQNTIMNLLDERAEQLKPQEIVALSNAYEKACRGERLEDGQAVEIIKEEKERKPDNLFHFLGEYQDVVNEQENRIKELLEILEKNNIQF